MKFKSIKFKSIKLMCSAILLFCFNVSAAVITYDTRAIDQSIDRDDLLASWLGQTSSINSVVMDDFSQVYSGRYTFSHLSIEFDSLAGDFWSIQAGLDAHYGAALYIDNQLVTSIENDIWWGYNWNSSKVLSATNQKLKAGTHTIDIYWAESCCNGYNSVEFSTAAAGGSWVPLSNNNIANAVTSVPEPAGVALMALGLFGVMYSRRRA